MDICSILTLIKQVSDTLGSVFGIIKSVADGVSSLIKERSQTSTTVLSNFEDLTKKMENPEDREKIDIERLKVYAKLTRNIIPFAFVEYLYYLTKVAGLVGVISVIYYWY